MSPERLLKHFEQISEAPDAVPRLRRFILDLAVRGKLVEQNPNDEPALELFKRIEIEKARLTHADNLRSQKVLPLDEALIPFSIPSNWVWAQLAQIGIINPRNDANDSTEASFIPMRMIFAEYGREHQHEVRPWGEIKKGFTHFAEGDVGLAKITPCFENGKSAVFRDLTGRLGAGTTELHTVRPIFVVADYVLIFLKSPHFIETGISKMTGTAGQKRVSKDYFAFTPFPLPPLAEQERIVTRVNELMTLCAKLGAAQAKREKRCDRLVAATLHGLNNGDASPAPGARPTFKGSARFYLNHFPHLTTRPEHIRQLHQTILNLAVRGRLIMQDPGDQPVSDLLKKINTEREEFMKKGMHKRKDAILDLSRPTSLFPIPDNWAWVRLQEIFLMIADGDHQPPPRAQTGIPFLVIGNVRNRKIEFGGNLRFVPEDYYSGIDEARLPRKGKILYTLVGSYGIPILMTDELKFCVQRHIGVLTPSKYLNGKYLALLLDSQLVFNQATACATGIAQKTVPLSGLRRITVPLPPLAEQHRIAAKVDELLALCDELESGIATTTATRFKLLEASLQEAFAS